ncbi:cysteine hydrolase family protein [Commensalibacter papalotli (ex Botero et al. 2024)]|uniref:Nicotinamidase-related amidase (PncA) (PDB:1ILW) n=1 Tax=Commensalibacter papalotli (ex Botero et al. 2024) TaxID=2972766 RepID=A0ABM9HI95_9PROT|nr:isochorismatase family cysteine hydrolase [Commensalibacter papalotli (ex Botero et al. 2024)]CAI3922590.1 Nicotinamidase-related amidase (PncA) (PDB:1ILW) [Commensalibacter papalotli (ex Botero et al. 2024)]CAI3929770.1 Nicotinamidase-related amidase (PncA) (PDB:1ILW) [Commensalibacter papalotli (ex Botero et al. 2024)]
MMASQTALILIEYQHDFTSVNGALHNGVKDCMHQTNMLANSQAALKAAREKGITVIYSPISFSDNYRELRKPTYGVLQNVISAKAFRQGSWGAEIIDNVKPLSHEIILEGKRGLDAFYSTNLDFILRQLNIKSLAICGFLTNCCVESTVRTAYEKGYDVTTLNDCCATLSMEEHNMALEKDLTLFSHVINHKEWLKTIG